MYAINSDIKENKLKSVYLLYGVEHYLVVNFRQKLLRAFCGTDVSSELEEDMNFASFKGKEISVAEMIQMSETLPFFAERRVILVEDSGLFSKDGDSLAEYLSEKPESTVFIFAEDAPDKRSRLFKAVEKIGHAAEFKLQDEATLKKWIGAEVAREGKKITIRAVEALIERCAEDMEQIKRELEKLFSYTLEREAIDIADVDAICSVRIGNHIFDMIEAMANKRQAQALGLYYELLALKEPPMRILHLISRQFVQLLSVKDLRNRGYDKRRISEKMEIKPFIVDKYMGQAGKFSTESLVQAINDCATYDEEVKKGMLSDRLCVELLLVKYSNGENR